MIELGRGATFGGERLDEAGNVTTSTCCPNTATEHAMMERLMLDAVALWARA